MADALLASLLTRFLIRQAQALLLVPGLKDQPARALLREDEHTHELQSLPSEQFAAISELLLETRPARDEFWLLPANELNAELPAQMLQLTLLPSCHGGHEIHLALAEAREQDSFQKTIHLPPAMLDALLQLPHGLVVISASHASARQRMNHALLAHQLNAQRHCAQLGYAQLPPAGCSRYEALSAEQLSHSAPQVLALGGLDTATLALAHQASDLGVLLFGQLRAPTLASAWQRVSMLNAAGNAPALADALAAVLHLSPVRRPCRRCSDALPLDSQMINTLLQLCLRHLPAAQQASQRPLLLQRWISEYALDGQTLTRLQPRGCAQCHGSGYRDTQLVAAAIVPSRRSQQALARLAGDEDRLAQALSEHGASDVVSWGVELLLQGHIDLAGLDALRAQHIA